jgi:RNA recognition motif-containing protein
VQVKRSKEPPNENKSRGFGFVTYELKEEAARAIQQLNGSMTEGREVRVPVPHALARSFRVTAQRSEGI